MPNNGQSMQAVPTPTWPAQKCGPANTLLLREDVGLECQDASPYNPNSIDCSGQALPYANMRAPLPRRRFHFGPTRGTCRARYMPEPAVNSRKQWSPTALPTCCHQWPAVHHSLLMLMDARRCVDLCYTALQAVRRVYALAYTRSWQLGENTMRKTATCARTDNVALTHLPATR